MEENTILEETAETAEVSAEISAEPDKKRFKKDLGRLGRGLWIYTLVNFLIVLTAMVREIIQIYTNVEDPILQEQQIEALSESGLSMIFGVGIGFFVLHIFMKKQTDIKRAFKEKKPMGGKMFFELLSVLMAAQLWGSLLFGLLEAGLNGIGMSALTSMEAATSSSETISMLIYASFAGPIAEELVYRGVVLQTLQKHGKGFAIVVSALLFGVMHGNIPQAVYAFGVGLILGYVAAEYSVWWSILLHVINNFVFGELLGILGNLLGENLQAVLDNLIIYGFFCAGILILVRKRKQIIQYVQENKSDGKFYRWTFTTTSIVLFIVLNLLLGISMFQKVG